MPAQPQDSWRPCPGGPRGRLLWVIHRAWLCPCGVSHYPSACCLLTGGPRETVTIAVAIRRAGTAAIRHRCRQVVAGVWGVSASMYGVTFGGREVLELGRGEDCSTLKCTECHWVVAHINGEIHGV